MNPGPGDGIVAAHHHHQIARKKRLHGLTDRLEGFGWRQRLQRHIARVMHPQIIEAEPRLEVIGGKPRQHAAQGGRSQIAAPRRQRALAQRYAKQSHGRALMIAQQVGNGQPAQSLRLQQGRRRRRGRIGGTQMETFAARFACRQRTE
jgi:hypothetical protein